MEKRLKTGSLERTNEKENKTETDNVSINSTLQNGQSLSLNRSKQRIYDPEYLKHKFTSTKDGGYLKPLCVVWLETLANISIKSSLLSRNLSLKPIETTFNFTL